MAVHQGEKISGLAKNLTGKDIKRKAGNVLTNHKEKPQWFSDKDLQI